MTVVSRAYNTFTIDDFGVNPTITKSSDNPKLYDEFLYLKEIQNFGSVRSLFPNVRGGALRGEVSPKYSMTMELFPMVNMYEFLMFHEGTWDRLIMTRLMEVLQKLHSVDTFEPNVPAGINMYVDKTKIEHDKYANNTTLFGSDLVINGVRFPIFESMWGDVQKLINDLRICEHRLAHIHGDFCFSNILVGVSHHRPIFKFIDPRGRWGNLQGTIGDPLYDYAKLYHSVVGNYEHIIYDRIWGKRDGNSIEFYVYRNSNLQANLQAAFQDTLPKQYTMQMVTLVMGLIFIGMCARHYDSPQRQLVMYATGISALHSALEM